MRGRNYFQIDIDVWLKGIKGYLNGMKRKIYRFTINPYFDTFILICVCANTILLALDGSVNSPKEIQLMEDF